MTLRKIIIATAAGALVLLSALNAPLALPRPAEASSDVTMLAAGDGHTCALLPAGAVKCWGDNTYGQLGDGTTTQRNTPVDVCASGTWNGSACSGSALTGATWIAAGSNHTCAAMTGGGIKCWGNNAFGRLGDGTTTDRHNPADVCASGAWNGSTCFGGAAVANGVRVTGGDLHTCALITTSGVQCWGTNGNGQLGDGTNSERHNPVDVCASGSGAGCGGGSVLTGVSLPTAGNAHTCALMGGSGVKCWGYNFDGELGDGNAPTDSTHPVDVCAVGGCPSLLSGASWVSAGGYHTCAVVAGGEVRCWGDNLLGQVGDGTAGNDRYTPVAVCANSLCSSNLTGAIYAGGGYAFSCAAMTGQTAKCWGLNDYGQLADGNAPNSSYTPRAVCADATCSAPISNLKAGGGEAGFSFACGVTIDRNVLCAGRNNKGQLGNGNPGVDSDTPVQVVGLSSKGGQTITTVDSTGNVGNWPAIQLDSSGNPVVVYSGIKVMHCGNPACTAGNVFFPPDSGGTLGSGSMALTASGNPVVSYVQGPNLRLIYCGNPTCTSGNTISTPDSSGHVTGDRSGLALDGSGNAVASYYDSVSGDLMLLHCTTIPTCATKTIQLVDDGGGADVGRQNSLVLDASGHPVISYYDATNSRLKVAHCDLVDCTGGISIAIPDTATNAGAYGTSIALDAAGNPIVAYGANDLKVLHCGDANCSSGNSIVSPDTAGDVGGQPSMRLDSSGNPVVSYGDGTNADLKVIHCGNPDCSVGNTIAAPDGPASVGSESALAIDAYGRPIVAYRDNTNLDLKVLHCGDATCGGAPAPVVSDLAGGGSGCPGHTTPPYDGCQGTEATLSAPSGITQSGADYYIADTNNCRVRRIDGSGIISTVAGNGTCGYNGENADSRLAQLNHPHNVFVSGTDLYIADTDNCRVRKVENVTAGTPGPISTVEGGPCGASAAGSGSAAGPGTIHPLDSIVDSSGSRYTLDATTCSVFKNSVLVVGTGACGTPSSSDIAPGTSVQLKKPNDIALLAPTDSIAISDGGVVGGATGDNRIRVYDPVTSLVSTIAGTGGAGNTGDGGPATKATMSQPMAITAANYRVYIADSGNQRIRRVNVLTKTIVNQLTPHPADTPVGVSIAADGTVLAYCTVNNVCQTSPGGENSDDTRTGNFVPVSGCGITAGAGMIDWALPVVFLGLVATRKRAGRFWRWCCSLLRLGRRTQPERGVA